ncbi:C4-dicarboxylate transporter DctM subunit [Natronocella acetinitrilica]|uniref:TRAP transporter large permease protein n=1 Tax=Natronocella acetinitrilica TaxID=414046 RepID=A0AAE3G754_9GAMM|nr:TRAP transporter large permease [Natronocella acetinitrilica]MCP1677110.1 C4-dicarboxylate transporter DctM subunit [Natronocella acetinitrilica]
MGAFITFLFTLLAVGFPIFIALLMAVMLFMTLNGAPNLGVVIQRMFSGVDSFPLMAIPFFILAGNLMSTGGLSKRLIRVAKALVGSLPGGLGMTTVSGSMFFSSISGSSPATVVAVGKLMYPAMINAGYTPRSTIGLLMSSGSLGIVIPPSIFMIVYGAVTGTSIGALFLAGVGAGLVYGICFLAYCYVHARVVGLPVQPRVPLREVWDAIRGAIWGLAIPFIILGGIYGGVFTPTEASGVAVIYAAFVSMVVYRELSVAELYRVLTESATMTAQVMIILAGAAAFSWFISTSGITRELAGAMIAISDNPIMVLVLINIIVLIAGMLLDPTSIIVILAPILYSVAMQFGVDPVHLGAILAVNAAVGMFTPPFGLNLFVASSVGNVRYGDAVVGALPLILIALAALLLVTYIPAISLWLPRAVYM